MARERGRRRTIPLLARVLYRVLGAKFQHQASRPPSSRKHLLPRLSLHSTSLTYGLGHIHRAAGARAGISSLRSSDPLVPTNVAELSGGDPDSKRHRDLFQNEPVQSSQGGPL
ncbi:hypothetical protein B0H14DRAFT_2975572, partial [Mycena olivaceomarginata]